MCAGEEEQQQHPQQQQQQHVWTKDVPRLQRFSRVLLKRSMLADHFLDETIQGLHRLQLLLLEDAAAAGRV